MKAQHVGTTKTQTTDGKTVTTVTVDETKLDMCIKAGIVSGSSADTLSQKVHLTRAEVAVMAQRLQQKSELI